MKKLWENIDDDDSDSNHTLYSIPSAAKYLQDTTFKATHSKRGRPKKKNKSHKTIVDSSSEY